ncbi:ABC transporter permease [Cohnella zeiphila]|uniref:Sugar ABC transporter permease n=1 Tax=Cohnella zeiphila TaxID=2761120 RepID=A0A7X0SH11_9BACL|nr:ABC transporter permease subunit [Cohnella zeiphila]MBB6729793.1 sugar ABC transporter permease [Cohnella zeiphila]
MENPVTPIDVRGGIFRTSRLQAIKKDFAKRKLIYFMLLPVVAFYVVFHYWPMYGAIIAFKNFSPARGILGSEWVGYQNFQDFFRSYYFFRVLRNTFLISIYELIFGFPAPILLALLLNELRNKWYKRVVQTVTYLPHFISLMVICGVVTDFLAKDGVINDAIAFFGGSRESFLLLPQWFRTIFVSTSIWQQVGWGSIIYLAALSGIDQQLYEAARMDGAGRFRQIWHITIPGIAPTIMILLILQTGHMMNVGFEKIILLYNPNTFETADVISSFVYRKGLLEMNYGYSAAVGLFNSLINFTLLILANWASKMAKQTSLW